MVYRQVLKKYCLIFRKSTKLILFFWRTHRFFSRTFWQHCTFENLVHCTRLAQKGGQRSHKKILCVTCDLLDLTFGFIEHHLKWSKHTLFTLVAWVMIESSNETRIEF